MSNLSAVTNFCSSSFGFWFKKESANAAAIKAFVVNRVGDFGFALGIFLIFYLFGTVNYNEVFQQIPTITDTNLNFLGIEVGAINLICFLFFRCTVFNSK